MVSKNISVKIKTRGLSLEKIMEGLSLYLGLTTRNHCIVIFGKINNQANCCGGIAWACHLHRTHLRAKISNEECHS